MSLLTEKRNEVQGLAEQLRAAQATGRIADIEIAQTAYSNARNRLNDLETELRDLKDRIDCLPDLETV